MAGNVSVLSMDSNSGLTSPAPRNGLPATSPSQLGHRKVVERLRSRLLHQRAEEILRIQEEAARFQEQQVRPLLPRCRGCCDCCFPLVCTGQLCLPSCS